MYPKIDKSPEDFRELLPLAVVVQTSAPHKVFDRLASIKFLTLAIATAREDEGTKLAAQILQRAVKAGLKIVIVHDTKIDTRITPSSLVAYAQRVLDESHPELVARSVRYRAAVMPDPFHGDAQTVMVWVFPTSEEIDLARRSEMLTKEQARSNAIHVEWDDNAIRLVFENNCSCGGHYYLINYYRNPYGPFTVEEILNNTKDTRIDVIHCKCASCEMTTYFPFVPSKIHSSVRELLKKNTDYIRLDPNG